MSALHRLFTADADRLGADTDQAPETDDDPTDDDPTGNDPTDDDPTDDDPGSEPDPPGDPEVEIELIDGGQDDHTVARSRDVVIRLLVAGAVAVVLSSQHLLEVAERMPFGTSRSVAVAAATTLDDAVGAIRLDLPDRWIRHAIGRPPPADGAGEGPDLLASQPVTVETIPPTVPPSGAGAAPTTAGPPVPGPADAAAGAGVPAEATTLPPGPQPRAIDPDDKLRIWAGGDSLGEYIGNRLLDPLANRELTEVELDFRISTGLTRPDYFNWQQQLWDVMHRERPPEALVFMVGGNDDQNMLVDGAVVELRSEAWKAEYGRRAAFVMDLASLGGGRLYWVGLPPMRDAQRHEAALDINTILAEQAAVRPWVTFVDIEQQFVGPDGNFSTNIADPSTGEQKVARADDGVHITLIGSTWIAEDIWASIDEHWSLSAPAPPADQPPPSTDASSIRADAPSTTAPAPDPVAGTGATGDEPAPTDTTNGPPTSGGP
jgi:hypothetical protein